MTDVLLVAHHERIQAAALARQAATWLADHGHSAWMTAGRRRAAGPARSDERAQARVVGFWR